MSRSTVSRHWRRDLFYEWRAIGGGKQPYAIGREDGAMLALGGVWEGWRPPEGEAVRTFTIVTTAANGDMAELHDRMPLVLEEADWPVWLGETEGDASALLRPAPEGTLRFWPVSTQVNSPRNNSADLIEALDPR